MKPFKPLKAFIKPFAAPKRSVKLKIYVNVLSSSGIGTRKVNVSTLSYKQLDYEQLALGSSIIEQLAWLNNLPISNNMKLP